MADTEEEQPMNGTETAEGEEQPEAADQDNVNENQTAEADEAAEEGGEEAAGAEEEEAAEMEVEETEADTEAGPVDEDGDQETREEQAEEDEENQEYAQEEEASENIDQEEEAVKEEAMTEEEAKEEEKEEVDEKAEEDTEAQEESGQREEGSIHEDAEQEEEQEKDAQEEEKEAEDAVKEGQEEQDENVDEKAEDQVEDEQITEVMGEEVEKEEAVVEAEEGQGDGDEKQIEETQEDGGEETQEYGVEDEGQQQEDNGDKDGEQPDEEQQDAAAEEDQQREDAQGEVEDAGEKDQQDDQAAEEEQATEGETGEETTPGGGDETEATPGGDDQEEGEGEEAAAAEGADGATEQQEEEEGEEGKQDQAEGGEKEEAEGSAVEKEQSDLNENANPPPSTAGEASVPAAPHLPSYSRSHTEIEGQMSTSALNIVWSFGLNRHVPVLNLSDGVRHAIMYPCAHVGIMYDFKNNKQHILQAHLNPITCSAVSQDKRWLVTGDVGPDAMVNIWDTYTGTPIQTMFDPNPQGGVVAVALTPDSRYLATLSALPVQTLAIWDWTVDGDTPICSADLKPDYGVQSYISFDQSDIHHVVTNSETQVLFYHWEEGTIKYYAPPLSDSDFNKPVGRYSQSLFQIGIARALTATSIGNLVVWDNNRPLSKIMDVNQSADKKPLKIIKVHDKGINVLTTTDSYIVLGDTAGHVKFYDQGLRLIYWYQDFHTGPCTAISFAYVPDFVPIAAEGANYPSDATKQAKPFVVRDFIVGTAIAVYSSMVTDGGKLKVIHREHDAAVHALAAHPKMPIIAIGSYSGLLKLWNYRTKEVVASRMFEKHHINSCAFDSKGHHIALGCTNGNVFLVDSVALLDQIKEPFKYARDAITHISFSHNSMYFATADSGFTITVYKRQRKEGRNPYTWHGRYRSHYKPIRDLLFNVRLDTNEPQLLSLGEDRMLIEYDLHHSGKTNNHIVPCAQDRIEQGAIPQCMINYPPITKEHFFLTANDQFKLKCYNCTTKMCRKTVLGPTYGSPIRKMMVVPTEKDPSVNRFLAYITDDKVGLHILPATGNPHLAMALIAHPSGVSNLACSYDGAYLFTAGGPDFAVHMWEINTAALEAQAGLGGEDLVPFYGLLEGGRDGELFAELEDLFYYAQLRHQGITSTSERKVGTHVPLTEVPYIMRAMGFYPSEQEIEDMLNEIKYDEYVSRGHYQEDIDLGRFIKLYVNHRPAFGLSPEKLLWAFKTLAESPELGKGGVIERGDLLDLLQKNGEHMTEYELAEHLTTLLGFNAEGGACEDEPFDAEKAGHFIADTLPYDVNAEILINEILGFSLTVDPPGEDNTKDVIRSGY